MINTVDVHAAGEPGRVVLGGQLRVEGATMAEQLQFCRENLEDLRQLLLHEPRGYPGLCGVLVLPAVHAGSDFGIVVLEQGGFKPMSGSNLICAVTAVLETKAVPVEEPVTRLRVDTAVGAVDVRADIAGGKVVRVTFDNVPAFAVAIDHPLELPEYGVVPVDIVFGGQYFVQARAADLGIDLVPGAARAIARAGAVLRAAAQRTFPVAHPLNTDIDHVALTMIHGPSSTPTVAGRNVVVLPNGQVDLDDSSTWTGTFDRSPCGTGTCGRMAALYARGELALGEEFIHEGFLGTSFTGILRDVTRVGDHPAVLPSISGRGWVTGYHQFVVDADDPFPCGYTVGDLWGPQTGEARRLPSL